MGDNLPMPGMGREGNGAISMNLCRRAAGEGRRLATTMEMETEYLGKKEIEGGFKEPVPEWSACAKELGVLGDTAGFRAGMWCWTEC